jgi:NAD(P)-dependent dehydrogenase (short-subunit alcohol dehydrogenase family)
MMPPAAARRVDLRVPGCAVLLSGTPAARNLGGMTTTLITGANKGLGREAARRLIAAGHDVWVAARDPGRGRETADALGARFVQLDVTDDASVAAAAEHVAAETGLDVLVNNAGITGERVTVEDTTAAHLRAVYETNVFGIVRVFGAFAPLLERSENPVVVNVSSGMGSIAITSDPERIESGIVALAYPSSKTAVNMLTTQYAKAYPRLRINAVDPGYTATDLNGHSGTQSVQEGTDAIVRMACLDAGGPTGTFTDRYGSVPW